MDGPGMGEPYQPSGNGYTLHGLIAFQDQLIGQDLILMSANAMAVAHINKQGGMLSESLWQLTQETFSYLEVYDIRTRARYILGKWNVIADLLSRSKQLALTE